jgi:Transposase
VLFIGDDWAEDHHDVEIVTAAGERLVRRRLPEGVAGLAGLHALIADHLGPDDEPDQVVIGIETDRGPWSKPCWPPVTWSTRSTRCKLPAIENVTRVRARKAIPEMRMCWPRWCAWTEPITA